VDGRDKPGRDEKASAVPGRSLCRGYDKARRVISISYGFARILYMIPRASCAGCWKIRRDRALLASRQAS